MLLLAGIILLIVLLMQPAEIRYLLKKDFSIPVLMPKGIIGLAQRNLLFFIQAIMLLVIIPVYILTFFFSWRYRAHTTKSKHDPEWAHSTLAEALWWGIPFVFTVIICVVMWHYTVKLDPYRPIESDKKPLTIQTVALQWKWLFIYPEEKIATVNYIQFPKDRPVHFVITADAPMNSLWIPQLGGQIYAMPNMRTELYLIADQEGEYRGSSANLSGDGFAGMFFTAKASSEEDYEAWIDSIRHSKDAAGLDFDLYKEVARPSQYDPVSLYQLKDEQLFDNIIDQYRPPKKIEN